MPGSTSTRGSSTRTRARSARRARCACSTTCPRSRRRSSARSRPRRRSASRSATSARRTSTRSAATWTRTGSSTDSSRPSSAGSTTTRARRSSSWPMRSARSSRSAGGGRYDYLIEEIGGPATPAVGIASGIERLVLSLQEQGVEAEQPDIDVFFAVEDDEVRGRRRSRRWPNCDARGRAADTDYAGRSLKGQLTQAGRLGADATVIVRGGRRDRSARRSEGRGVRLARRGGAEPCELARPRSRRAPARARRASVTRSPAGSRGAATTAVSSSSTSATRRRSASSSSIPNALPRPRRPRTTSATSSSSGRPGEVAARAPENVNPNLPDGRGRAPGRRARGRSRRARRCRSSSTRRTSTRRCAIRYRWLDLRRDQLQRNIRLRARWSRSSGADGGGRVPRHRDADPGQADARGRARLPRPVASAAGQVLRAAAVAADPQAAARDLWVRALLPDRALLPGRGSARRSPAGADAARRRDGVPGPRVHPRADGADRRTHLARDDRRRARDAVPADVVAEAMLRYGIGQARPALRPGDPGCDRDHARLGVRRLRERAGGALPERPAGALARGDRGARGRGKGVGREGARVHRLTGGRRGRVRRSRSFSPRRSSSAFRPSRARLCSSWRTTPEGRGQACSARCALQLGRRARARSTRGLGLPLDHADMPMLEWSEEEAALDGAAPSVHAPDGGAVATARRRTPVARARSLTTSSGTARSSAAARSGSTSQSSRRGCSTSCGISPEEQRAKFGFLLDALGDGCAAARRDRIRDRPAGDGAAREPNIRDTQAFPKNQAGFDPMSGAPSDVPTEQLDELGLQLAPPKKES